MKTSKRVFKWWGGWKTDGLEQWLENQEQLGWNLSGISGSCLWFSFEKGASRKIAYRIDYQPRVGDDYFRLFGDAGWKLAGKGNGWYFWSQGYESEKPEIFSDTQAAIDRNNRLLALIGLISLIQVPGIRSVAARIQAGGGLFYQIVIAVQAVLLVAMVAIIVRFLLANRQLKKERRAL